MIDFYFWKVSSQYRMRGSFHSIRNYHSRILHNCHLPRPPFHFRKYSTLIMIRNCSLYNFQEIRKLDGSLCVLRRSVLSNGGKNWTKQFRHWENSLSVDLRLTKILSETKRWWPSKDTISKQIKLIRYLASMITFPCKVKLNPEREILALLATECSHTVSSRQILLLPPKAILFNHKQLLMWDKALRTKTWSQWQISTKHW